MPQQTYRSNDPHRLTMAVMVAAEMIQTWPQKEEEMHADPQVPLMSEAALCVLLEHNGGVPTADASPYAMPITYDGQPLTVSEHAVRALLLAGATQVVKAALPEWMNAPQGTEDALRVLIEDAGGEHWIDQRPDTLNEGPQIFHGAAFRMQEIADTYRLAVEIGSRTVYISESAARSLLPPA